MNSQNIGRVIGELERFGLILKQARSDSIFSLHTKISNIINAIQCSETTHITYGQLSGLFAIWKMVNF